MGLDFDPRLDSSGSRSRRKKTKSSSRGASASSGRRASSRASSSGSAKPVKGKRKSVGASARASAQRSAAAASSKGKKKSKEEKQLAKLEKKNAKLERKAAKRAGRSASGRDAARPSIKQGVAGQSGDEPQRDGQEPEGVRVGDIRRREREERAKRARARYRRYVLRIVLIVVSVLTVFFGAIFLYRSDVLRINNVQVTGVSHLTSQEITDIAAVPADSTLLRLDAAGITSRLESHAWIQSVSIHREFPDTIRIDVVERTPGAVVRINDNSTWVISSDGTWLSAANDEDWDTLMRIIDVSSSLEAPVSGGTCGDGGIVNALEILESISDDFKNNIESISAESSIKTSLNLKNGITVAFGDSSDIELKEAVVNELLAQYEGTISYINVRVPDHPTYRTLSE